MKFLIATLLIGFNVLANNADSERLYKEDNKITPAKKVLIEMENHQFSQVQSNGLSENISDSNDNKSLVVAYNFSSDFRDFSAITGFDISYNHKSSSFTKFWYSFNFKSLSAKYDAIASEVSSSSTDVNSNNNTLREKNTQTMTQFGIGIGYQFSFFADSFHFSRVTEMATAYLSMVQAKDSTDSESYSGYSVSADYLINYRLSKSFYAGTKLNYTMMSLKRAKKNQEKLEDRSLVYGWLSLGLHLGFYF